MYSDLLAAYGEAVTLRRVSPLVEAQILGRVTSPTPEELAAGISQSTRKVLVLAEDVELSAFPVPIRTGSTDRIVVRGKALMVETVDDSTVRIGNTLVAYLITATGG